MFIVALVFPLFLVVAVPGLYEHDASLKCFR